MAKTYKITFDNRAMAGLALWEIVCWGVKDSEYTIDKKATAIKYASANVVDVVTESVPSKYFTVETE